MGSLGLFFEPGGRPRRLGGLFSTSVAAPPSSSSCCAFAALERGFVGVALGLRSVRGLEALDLEVGFREVEGDAFVVGCRLRRFCCGFSASEASSCSSSDSLSFRLGDGRMGDMPTRDRDRVERAGEGDVRAKTRDFRPRERTERPFEAPSSDELLGGSTTTTPHLRLRQLTSLSS